MTDAAVEMHVVPLGFGRYGVFRGVAVHDKPVTRAEAYALVNFEITAQELKMKEMRARR